MTVFYNRIKQETQTVTGLPIDRKTLITGLRGCCKF